MLLTSNHHFIKFLDDLTDADVLIHVLDSSGTADAEGNTVVAAGSEDTDAMGSNPIDDLDWIFNELIQWVFLNITAKWDAVVRKGRHKVSSAFDAFFCELFDWFICSQSTLLSSFVKAGWVV